MKTIILIGILAAMLSGTTHAAQRTFNDPTVTERDGFGYSVALDGNYILIGAPEDDTLGPGVGQAHLFDAVTGNLLQTFDDPTISDTDRFGFSVALDGNNVLIGARSHFTSEASNVGQAHLFDATTGNLLHTFDDPTPTVDDQFGESVALDGNNVLIGAYNDSTLGSPVGQAHLFDATTGNLLRTFNDPTVTEQDGFGQSVALDGNNILIGAIGDDTLGSGVGQAHLFDATTGNLLRTFNDPTVTESDSFGHSVTLDGNNVLINAVRDDTNGTNFGQAHLFDAVTGNLLQTFDNPTVAAADFFGSSVALDGNHVLISTTHDDMFGEDVGQAYLFDAVTGNLLRTFNDPTVTERDQFGQSVALDGNNVLISAYGDDTQGSDIGQAHLFFIEELPDPTADFNSDDNVDGDDLNIWDTYFGLTDPFGRPLHEFGDADEDSDIDGNDFLIWQREFVRESEPLPPPTADFNDDGSVDEQDLTTWQAGFGVVDPFGRSLHEFGDADEDSDIDGRDFLTWQREFGRYSAAVSSASVPEPCTLLIILAALVPVALTQRPNRIGRRVHQPQANGRTVQ